MEESIPKLQQNELNDKRPQFGNRVLSSSDNIFQHNAWYLYMFNKENYKIGLLKS